MSDLFVTDHVPRLGSGRALRVHSLILALAELGSVDVLYVNFGGGEPDERLLADPGVRLHAVESSRGLGRAVSVLRARRAGTPAALARVASPELVARARALAPAPGTGRVVADGAGIRMALRRLERSHGVIYNAHNLEHTFQEALGDEALAPAGRVAQFERALLTRSPESWMVSRRDVDGARALAPSAAVRYVPNVVDVASIAPVRPRPPGEVVLFAADHTWPPNQVALALLLDEVMPAVWAERPEARLVVTGRGLDLPADVDERIEPLGFVDDVDAQYRRASCVVVPLLTGGGSPLKFVEALAYGLPVVATPHAAKGLELEAGSAYLEGADGPALAAQVVAVLRDGAPEVAEAGRAVAAERYSVQTLVRLLAQGAPA